MRPLRVIALTAMSLEEDRDDALAAGMDDWMRYYYSCVCVHQSHASPLCAIFLFARELVKSLSWKSKAAICVQLDYHLI